MLSKLKALVCKLLCKLGLKKSRCAACPLAKRSAAGAKKPSVKKKLSTLKRK